jgi:hypothetical protein
VVSVEGEVVEEGEALEEGGEADEVEVVEAVEASTRNSLEYDPTWCLLSIVKLYIKYQSILGILTVSLSVSHPLWLEKAQFKGQTSV